MRKNIFNTCVMLCLALTTGLLSSCKKEVDQWANVEALIKSLQITNAGLSGGETITGTVNNTDMTVVFNDVPAESNIYAVKLGGKFSLGASLDTTVYDFSNPQDPAAMVLTHDVRINNYGDKHNTYKVTINLRKPESAPILEKLVMEDSEGNTYPANIVAEENTIYLGMEGKGSAKLKEMTVTPARSTVVFSAMDEGGNIPESAPGTLVMNFMGLETSYAIDFTAGSAGGIDYAGAVVHDFSIATGNCPDYFAGELVRGSDFDGSHVLIVSRSDATTPTPRMFKVDDLLNNNANAPIMLSTKGMEGGTHIVSAGRLSQGHAYICNLSTDISADPLKVYHYSSPTADPEVVLSWDGTGIDNADDPYAGRLGDNISVNLDANGNGYAFFCKQEPGDKIYRFTVTGFTSFSDPHEIDLHAVCSYYGYVNEIPSEPGNYLFTSSYVPYTRLIDKEGTTLYEMEFDWTDNGARPNHGVDPRVIMFNRSRFFLFTVANSQGMHWNFGPVLYLIDITDGYNTLAALAKLDYAFWEEGGWEPNYEYFIGAEDGTTTASACSAQCNAAEVNGKLVVYTAAVNAGFALIEFPKAK